jgi:hypothetical protein
MHRVSIVSLFAGVDIEATAEQEIHIFQPTRERCDVQQRVLVRFVAGLELFGVRV